MGGEGVIECLPQECQEAQGASFGEFVTHKNLLNCLWEEVADDLTYDHREVNRQAELFKDSRVKGGIALCLRWDDFRVPGVGG